MKLCFDPRMKLYLLLLANLLLFFHVNTKTEAVITVLFLIPFFLYGKWKSGIRFGLIYLTLLLLEPLAVVVTHDFLRNLLGMLSVGFRMMLPCIITGAYAFSTTTVSEFVCALRRIHVPESVIIPCMVVIRFFPTIREDYHQIKNAMALRGIAVGNLALLRHPAQSLEYILIPLLMNASNVAQDLSVAALTKGIGRKGNHTSMVEIKMKAADWGYMALCTVPFAMFLGGSL